VVPGGGVPLAALVDDALHDGEAEGAGRGASRERRPAAVAAEHDHREDRRDDAAHRPEKGGVGRARRLSFPGLGGVRREKR
jgi:hypothetical protein